MNVRASPHDLDRIRSAIGAALRVEHDSAAEPAPQRLMDLLGQLEIHARAGQREKVFADVDAAVACWCERSVGSLLKNASIPN
jgi:hypothetical protein